MNDQTNPNSEQEKSRLSEDVSSTGGSAIKSKLVKKKLVVLGVVAVAVIAVAFAFLHKSKFEQVRNECVQIAGMIVGNGDYFTIDTYPDSYENIDDNLKALLLTISI